jgi:hypothetical protein
MKRETREWLKRVVCDAAAPQDFEAGDAADILDSDARQRAEIRDLKARLAEALDRMPLAWRDPVITACFDLKNKNWRKP